MICLSLTCVPDVAAQETDAVSFNQQIRPLLSDRCFACHGPDAESREAGLRLDVADGPEGAFQSAIVPGSVEDSELWRRITSDDDDERMPPPESHKPPLTEQQLKLFKRWIETGADYKKFWAFEPAKMPAMPAVDNPAWSQQPIDLQVLKQLESLAREPSREADPRTLIRRVTLDLTGLPPTQDDVTSYLQDHQHSPDDAWEKLVNRLLARPQYGEHMARYWLDLVRFADTNGMHKDFYRNHVAYRDWVIRAFNQNLGYDDFVRYQLAGDLYGEPSDDQLVASGFHRLHLIIDRGTALPEESHTKNVLDRVTSVGTAFMGMTVHCAQCHDHKYDPLTQKDFYSLFAFFNNIDAEPETVTRPRFGLQPPFVSFGSPQQEQELSDFNQQLEELEKTLNAISKALEDLEKAEAKAERAAEEAGKEEAEKQAERTG